MNKHGERADAQHHNAAALGVLSGAIERAQISGRFDAVLHRCKAEHEREYGQLLTHVGQLRARAMARQRALSGVPRLAQAASRRLLDRADEVSEYMRSLMEVQAEIKAPNVVTNIGGACLLDNGLAGSSYTAAFFLGLISSVSYSAVAAADTMASHAGWTEAGPTNAPNYSETTRRTAAWSAASGKSKSLSAGLVFTFTNSGTVRGCFLTTNSTKDGTTGTLYSAGLFTGGDQPVVSTNTLTVSYTATL